jgi:ribonuclease D
MMSPAVYLVDDDLPEGVSFPDGRVAVDTETTGLEVTKVKLCLCQVGDGQGNVWLVKFRDDYKAPRLKAVLGDAGLTKLFHFARFDVAILQHNLGIKVTPAFCTKIGHKLAHPSAPKHNLRALVQQYCGVTLDKGEQMSDWSAPELTESQKAYAASDVAYLHRIHDGLQRELADSGLAKVMADALAFLPARIDMDLRGLPEQDLFSHT